MPRSTSTFLPERNLDILRSIAVMCVVASHVIEPWTRQIRFMSVFQLGRIGVLMFFVHTSLVLMASLERLESVAMERAKWVWAFYVKRVFRIYPLAMTSVLVVLAVRMPTWYLNRGPHPAYNTPSTKTIVSNLLLTQNLTYSPDILGPLWTLPIELQMYLVLPLLYLLARRSWNALLVALGVAMIAGFAEPIVPGLSRLTVLLYGPCFIAGVIAYRLCLTTKTTFRLPAWTWPIAIGVVSAGYVWEHPTLSTFARAWPFCLALGLLIPFFNEVPESWLTRITTTMAKYSYGIYLCHIIVLWIALVVFYTAPLAVKAVIFVVGVALFSFLAYHVIEAPGIAFGARLARRLSGQAKPAIGYVAQAPEAPAP